MMKKELKGKFLEGGLNNFKLKGKFLKEAVGVF